MDAPGSGWVHDAFEHLRRNPAVEGLQEAAASAYAAASEFASSMVDSISSTPIVRKTQSKAEKMAAQWRWSGRSLGSMVRVPLSTEIDERLLLSCTLAALRVLSSSSVPEEDGRPGRPSLLLPPATMALFLASLGVFYKPGGVLLREVCLSPFCVVEKEEYARLFLSAIVHVDTAHLVQNLAVAVPECAILERRLGSSRMALELVSLTALSHGLYVAWAVYEKEALHRSQNYYSVGVVGLSSLAFALQVTCGASSQGSAYVAFLPLAIPKKFIWSVHMLLSHVSCPNSSMVGHLCGVLAGLLHSYVLAPFVRYVVDSVGNGDGAGGGGGGSWQQQQQQPRFWGAGTGGGRGVMTRHERGRGRPPWWHGAGHWLKELGLQVALAAAVTGICIMFERRPGRGRQPYDLWPVVGSK